ncbi:MAG: hypothetical protein GY854_22095 [Deltaproteobacteria bacterium]|nr:hypothetical protein [Deltaproteobacteria bacterium]
MKRIHLIEFHEQRWCPASIRNGLTGIIQCIADVMPAYDGMLPPLIRAMRYSGSTRIVDFCSGSGGPWRQLLKWLPGAGEIPREILLTDLHPNYRAFSEIKKMSNGRINYVAETTDATNAPKELEGFRTFFASFHHFRPEIARRVLQDAVDKKTGIGIFEMTEHRLWSIFFIGIASIFLTLGLLPFVRPFRWSLVFWTYIFPILPIVVTIDGIVSALRSYSLKELKDMTDSLEADDYEWHIWRQRNRFSPLPVTCLLGYRKWGLFGEVALKLKMINEEQLAEVAALRKKTQLLRIGEICVEKGYLNPEQVKEILLYQTKFAKLESQQHRDLFGEVALRLKFLSKEQLAEVAVLREKDHAKRIGEICVEKGYLEPEQVETILEDQVSRQSSPTP